MQEKNFNDIQFDELLESMRAEDAPEAEFSAARERVWHRLAAESSALPAALPTAAESVCINFREQFAAYQQGALSGARKLLMEDHLGRCSACRRAFAQFEGRQPKVVSIAAPKPSAFRAAFSQPWAKWAVAASLALVGVYAGRDRIDSLLAPQGPRATVASINGQIYNLSGVALKPGAPISENEIVRTGPGSHARLQLADGSQVEVNERTQLAVLAAWSGQTISLERGDIIVEAAKQRRGRLRVVTRDSVASVKGTVFAVSSGLSGSFVGVVRGAVEVQQSGASSLLTPGQHAASSPTLQTVEVSNAIEWSQDREKYFALLSELKAIEKEIARVLSPTSRTSTRLLNLIPAQTLVYAAIPNLGNAIDRAVDIIEQRARDNATLRQWWESNNAGQMKTVLEKIQSISPMLGDEIVFVLAGGATFQDAYPLLMAEVRPGQNDTLLKSIDAAVAGIDAKGFAREISGDILLISQSADKLARARASLGQGASSQFARDLAARYARGVSWLWAANLDSLGSHTEAPAASFLGTGAMKNVVIEMRSANGNDLNEASLGFSGARTGIASWLAAPAPAGSSEYIPTEALAAFSANTRNPKQVFDELSKTIGKFDKGFAQAVSEVDQKVGVNLGDDVVAALGNDFSFALTPPALPLPGWFFAIEVYNPGALNTAIERLVEASNRELSNNKSDLRVSLSRETVDGREWLTLNTGNALTRVTWTFDRGYMVMATDRAIARNAIDTRNGGFPLVHSAAFRAELPPSGNLHQSAFFWINTQGSLATLSGLAPTPSMKALMENRNPALFVIDGETERIRAYSRTRITSLVLDMLAAGGADRPKPNSKSAVGKIQSKL